ncbi:MULTISPECIES: BMP family ABC transporter substrate-binding protein [Arthrobacter]|uniref:BMP family ABC transporter substrate-binding protein n=2 Tax=Arthrobacter TaxID=1663 RepID=A0ABU9KPL4_9MICC|nr:BMP family ABC transporter substrate-binding protein [Arthrobacter sp. YJM1]MDP5227442.1 BMP family ABC transporter substrate-binding protein [Arthrobacter sp. YJM1]
MKISKQTRGFGALAKRGSLLGVAGVSAAALVLSACGAAPDQKSGSTAGASNYKACMVGDTAGFDDQSFNQSSYEGLQKAEKDLGISINKAESKSNNDYEPNLRAMTGAGCNLTITVGFLLGDATKAQAAATPDKHFAIIDFAYDKDIPNVKPIIYDTAQAAFLAGYLAAGTTKTGKVGTFGGMKLPTVTIFMDGFADGVKYYNEKKGKNVQLLGWDKDKQDGSFTNSFDKQDVGKQLTKGLIDGGADIILPVAGQVSKGAGAAVKEAKAAGKDIKLIWVDSDGYLTAPDYKDLMLSSVMKKMGEAVETVIKEDKGNTFTSKPYVGTLANGGVDLAPFHSMDSAVPADVKSDLDQIKKDIIDGKIKVDSVSSPKQ